MIHDVERLFSLTRRTTRPQDGRLDERCECDAEIKSTSISNASTKGVGSGAVEGAVAESRGSRTIKMRFGRILLRWRVILCLVVFATLFQFEIVMHLQVQNKDMDLPSHFDAHSEVASSYANIGQNTKNFIPASQPTKSFVPTTYQPTQISTVNNTTTTSPPVNHDQINIGFIHRGRINFHPRVACFTWNNDPYQENPKKKAKIERGASCDLPNIKKLGKQRRKSVFSIPIAAATINGKNDDEEAEDEAEEVDEDDTCKYVKSLYQSSSAAPSTCNDIHSFGFDDYVFGDQRHPNHRSGMIYIKSGGAKSVWKVTNLDDNQSEEHVIMKTNKYAKFMKKKIFWDLSRQDALVAGMAGSSQLSVMIESLNTTPSKNAPFIGSNSTRWNHVLPLYGYCALANIVPFATAGTLDEYIKNYASKNNGQRMDLADMLQIALQAARGLYQAHSYVGGKATFVHADLNPSQYLVFKPYSGSILDTQFNSRIREHISNKLPILQINDFNQGRFLRRSIKNNQTCPFRVCGKNSRGGRYHYPERFLECVDQNDAIDTFSLGGIFYFLLSNGKDPYYNLRSSFNRAIKAGELPLLPENAMKERELNHPAYIALKEIMIKCMALKLEDRPTSLEVVHMLEKIFNMHESLQIK